MINKGSKVKILRKGQSYNNVISNNFSENEVVLIS